MKMRAPLILSIALVLTACAPTREKSSFGIRGVINLVKTQFFRGKTNGSQAGMGLKRAMLKGVKTRLVLARLEGSSARSALALVGNNRGFRSYMSPDKRQIVLQDGVLEETRGLAGDLMSSDISALTAALKKPRQPAKFSHTMFWLNGENHQIRARFICQLEPVGLETITIVERSYNTRHVRENCNNGTYSFVNDYWISRRDGEIWKSRQWIGPVTGYITLQLLVR